ncbi:Trypsin-like serine protease [Candidatus Terasakiella magnetica]|uniref:Probable membrane transporter protein n=1 Tax=Candidatus Terasakiella magnetica TaxID=1867952 RepID=A0A1C3RFQ5_9PROT|nr:TSUP family transporter [Candidatus Terasakiella magnetica]SCA56088.1 Trypsin-like serine protease [Candidatus Terasakiella magnetica]
MSENEEVIKKPTLFGAKGFCSSPWQGLAIGFLAMVILTFVWGFIILNGYKEDTHFEKHKHLGLSEFLLRDAAGAPDKIASALAPGIVGISGALPNMPLMASGSLVSPQGHVLTVLHPLQNLDQLYVYVRTAEGIKPFKAEVIETNANHNLAILKIISKKRFQYFTLANASNLEVKSPVIALGQTRSGNVVINQGQLQTLDTTLNVAGKPMKALAATDAVFSWHQTGGPLVNRRGEIVGVNLAFNGKNGVIDGFMIPTYVVMTHFADVVNFKVGQDLGANAAAAPAAWKPKQQVANNGSVTSNAWWQITAATQAQQGATVNPNTQSNNNTFGMNVVANGVNHAMTDLEHLGGTRILGFPLKDIVGLALLGLGAGLISGMMTMGGGILHVAGMMIVFGYGIYLIRPVAYLTNLFIFGAAAHRNIKSGLVMWDTVKKLLPWAVIGMVGGYFIGNYIGDGGIAFLLGAFALTMTLKGLHEIFAAVPDNILVKSGDKTVDEVEVIHEGDDDSYIDDLLNEDKEEAKDGPFGINLKDVFLGLPIGLISGILGISGGVLAVPLQRFFKKQAIQNAIANSSVVVFWASAMGALVAFIHGTSAGLIDWETPLIMTMIMVPGAFAGGALGARLMKVLPSIFLKWFYTIIMAAIAVKILFLS